MVQAEGIRPTHAIRYQYHSNSKHEENLVFVLYSSRGNRATTKKLYKWPSLFHVARSERYFLFFVRVAFPTQLLLHGMYTTTSFLRWLYSTAHIACITSRVGREKNNSGTPIGHVYLASVHDTQKSALNAPCTAVKFVSLCSTRTPRVYVCILRF